MQPFFQQPLVLPAGLCADPGVACCPVCRPWCCLLPCVQTLAQFKQSSLKAMGDGSLDRDFGGEVPLEAQV